MVGKFVLEVRYFICCGSRGELECPHLWMSSQTPYKREKLGAVLCSFRDKWPRLKAKSSNMTGNDQLTGTHSPILLLDLSPSSVWRQNRVSAVILISCSTKDGKIVLWYKPKSGGKGSLLETLTNYICVYVCRKVRQQLNIRCLLRKVFVLHLGIHFWSFKNISNAEKHCHLLVQSNSIHKTKLAYINCANVQRYLCSARGFPQINILVDSCLIQMGLKQTFREPAWIWQTHLLLDVSIWAQNGSDLFAPPNHHFCFSNQVGLPDRLWGQQNLNLCLNFTHNTSLSHFLL